MLLKVKTYEVTLLVRTREATNGSLSLFCRNILCILENIWDNLVLNKRGRVRGYLSDLYFFLLRCFISFYIGCFIMFFTGLILLGSILGGYLGLISFTLRFILRRVNERLGLLSLLSSNLVNGWRTRVLLIQRKTWGSQPVQSKQVVNHHPIPFGFLFLFSHFLQVFRNIGGRGDYWRLSVRITSGRCVWDQLVHANKVLLSEKPNSLVHMKWAKEVLRRASCGSLIFEREIFWSSRLLTHSERILF